MVQLRNRRCFGILASFTGAAAFLDSVFFTGGPDSDNPGTDFMTQHRDGFSLFVLTSFTCAMTFVDAVCFAGRFQFNRPVGQVMVQSRKDFFFNCSTFFTGMFMHTLSLTGSRSDLFPLIKFMFRRIQRSSLRLVSARAFSFLISAFRMTCCALYGPLTKILMVIGINRYYSCLNYMSAVGTYTLFNSGFHTCCRCYQFPTANIHMIIGIFRNIPRFCMRTL